MSLVVDIRKALASFDLEVCLEVGDETLGFLGASGCGKSMTLRCIAGVETPDEGKIVVNGITYFDSAAKVNLSAQKRKTALLFQNFQLFPNLTVEANVAAGLDKGLDSAGRTKAVARQIKRFHLEGMEKRFPHRLSGGQQQRVALARMLAASPQILMLDEPFSALDAHLKLQLEQDLLDLFDAFEGSILYVSHDIDEAFRFCDRIAVVEQGKIQEVAPTQDIVHNPQTLAAIKLSGCKNITAASYLDEHRFRALDWGGIELFSERKVPKGIRYAGVRAFLLSKASGQARNVVPCDVLKISDSRFERAVTIAPKGFDASNSLIWRCDKFVMDVSELPEKGDAVDIHFDEESIYMVER